MRMYTQPRICCCSLSHNRQRYNVEWLLLGFSNCFVGVDMGIAVVEAEQLSTCQVLFYWGWSLLPQEAEQGKGCICWGNLQWGSLVLLNTFTLALRLLSSCRGPACVLQSLRQ